jgi:hypothetical protein
MCSLSSWVCVSEVGGDFAQEPNDIHSKSFNLIDWKNCLINDTEKLLYHGITKLTNFLSQF